MGLDLTGIGSVADLAKGIIDRFFPPDIDPAKKAEIQIKMEAAIAERENQVMGLQRDIIVAEMQQSDEFTKRARPTIVYAGLLFIFLVHVLLPMLAFFTSRPMPTLALPAEFWMAWGGVCSIWIIGRSAEKRGVNNSIVSAITGGLKR